VFCQILGFVGSEYVLGHWKPALPPGEGTVVALDIRDVTLYPPGSSLPRPDPQFDDPALRRVVVSADAPRRVSFASDLIGQALDAGDSGAP
jgi:hypothetical protein